MIVGYFSPADCVGCEKNFIGNTFSVPGIIPERVPGVAGLDSLGKMSRLNVNDRSVTSIHTP